MEGEHKNQIGVNRGVKCLNEEQQHRIITENIGFFRQWHIIPRG